MSDDRQSQARSAILRAVLGLLEEEGYDALKLRHVAARARVSLSTIYKHFEGRDELIVEALQLWMNENAYSQLKGPIPEALPDALLWMYRKLFDPWARSPRILEAYYRARLGPGGQLLDEQGAPLVEPVASQIFGRLDPGYAEDLAITLQYLLCSMLERAGTGDVEIRDVFDMLERAVSRLTGDNSELARGEREPAMRRPGASRSGARRSGTN